MEEYANIFEESSQKKSLYKYLHIYLENGYSDDIGRFLEYLANKDSTLNKNFVRRYANFIDVQTQGEDELRSSEIFKSIVGLRPGRRKKKSQPSDPGPSNRFFSASPSSSQPGFVKTPARGSGRGRRGASRGWRSGSPERSDGSPEERSGSRYAPSNRGRRSGSRGKRGISRGKPASRGRLGGSRENLEASPGKRSSNLERNGGCRTKSANRGRRGGMSRGKSASRARSSLERMSNPESPMVITVTSSEDDIPIHMKKEEDVTSSDIEIIFEK